MFNRFLATDEWQIREVGFHPDRHEACESLFSIGNGKTGQRANFEEKYSGKTLQGSYVAGVYYPDKTRVGWWKNGYPEYFAKVLNSASWIGIGIKAGDEELDLAVWRTEGFTRTLNMRQGLLQRNFKAISPNKAELEVSAERFISMADDELAAICYNVKSANFSGVLTLSPGVNGDVRNKDANYDEIFWEPVSQSQHAQTAVVTMRTRKTGFVVGTGMDYEVMLNGKPESVAAEVEVNGNQILHHLKVSVKPGDSVTLIKYAAICSSLFHEVDEVDEAANVALYRARIKGYDNLRTAHTLEWEKIWNRCDILIDGDPEAQQGIRFNIFQLYQTYTGSDARLNIGPKGFTGEKYGGSTYWDTEAYCLPFYMATGGSKIGRQLLEYRYRHLPKAIENAAKLGFTGGAALYPMVTMNGEECHNEWEITFEEIHRNGAIAYAIFNYIRYTGDEGYLTEGGLEVLIGISRFWAQRVNWSEDKKLYVMLGVTGPNEYENNVNNNWYTSYIACWCLRFTLQVMEKLGGTAPEKLQEIIAKTSWVGSEAEQWRDIIAKMYYPYNDNRQIFLQQEGYLDKEQRLASDLPLTERPINQHWSWDRILRSCFIKQADVLQGFYFFMDDFDEATHRRHFEFYEPRTVHESSLSPSIHVVLAARLGMDEKAYELYLRTSRLDLDDYNREVHEGLHITSMAGTWLSVIQGFCGMEVKDGKLQFASHLPGHWQHVAFKVIFREKWYSVLVTKNGVEVNEVTA